MSIMARYSGTCSECGGRWAEGDLIRSETIPRTSWGQTVWVHAVCPDDLTDSLTIRKGESVCETCWLVHPEGACDR